MSKYKITVNSYWKDGTGYYLGRSGENATTVYADSTDDAIKKVKELRKDSAHSRNHDTQVFVIGEIVEQQS